MLGPAELAAALATIAGRPLTGNLYRAVSFDALKRYDPPQPLYSLSAPRRGARYTPRDGMPTLYVAEDVETAYAEANQISV
jgi:RES domain-containing protein